MNCTEYELALGDSVDGTIDVTAAEGLRVHLAACGRCRALADDLRAIRAAARTLERPEPATRNWHRIAATSEQDRSRHSGVSSLFAWRPLALAATILLAAMATWWMLRPVPSAELAVSDPQAVSAPQGEGLADESVDAEFQMAAAHYESVIAGLEEIARDGGIELDPMTAEVLQANLSVIDMAIDESRAAMATEPSSDLAQATLFDALGSKLALLQDTVSLINDMRTGNEDGAALGAPEVNP